MANLRESDIRTKFELLRKGIGNVYVHPLMHHQLNYTCDWCLCFIDEFDFVFQCSGAQDLERHDYCMSCVGTVITMTQELNVFLKEILRTQLVPDCIRCIVDHAIGRMVVSQCNKPSQILKKESSLLKSTRDHALVPSAGHLHL